MNIDFLYSHTDVLSIVSKDIISYNSKYGIKTRSQTKKATSSCRMWQLIFSLLDNLQKRGLPIKELIDGHSLGLSENEEHLRNYNLMISNISSLIDSITSDETSDLYRIIYQNDSSVSGISELSSDMLEYGNNYLCIYNTTKGFMEYFDNILHFFTIIRTEDNKYFLNSSYSSDYVCVNQYTTPIEINEIERFLNALNNPNTDESYIGEFYMKFFLKDNKAVAYSKDDYEDDSSKRFTMIQPDEGALREINVITQNLNRRYIKCGVMTNYDTHINELINSMNGGKRYKKKNTRRIKERQNRINKTLKKLVNRKKSSRLLKK